jgi:hypothetical protein
MAAAQPQAPAPPTRWQCHVCNAGPYLYANATRCTNIGSNNRPCNHDFCHDKCKKDHEIPPPLASADSSPRRLHATPDQFRSTSLVTRSRQFISPGSKSHRHRSLSGSASPGAGRSVRKRDTESVLSLRPSFRNDDVQCRSRPSMAGWWKCHLCTFLNNPDLACGRCTSCAHPGPCPSCTRL